MSKNWPTKQKDMQVAEKIMEQHATKNDTDALGLFELVLNKEEKRLNFRLSNWVVTLAEHFKSAYGADQGDYITRKVITGCLVNGQTLH